MTVWSRVCDYVTSYNARWCEMPVKTIATHISHLTAWTTAADTDLSPDEHHYCLIVSAMQFSLRRYQSLAYYMVSQNSLSFAVTATQCQPILPRDATQSAVLPRQVVCLSVTLRYRRLKG